MSDQTEKIAVCDRCGGYHFVLIQREFSGRDRTCRQCLRCDNFLIEDHDPIIWVPVAEEGSNE